jgi:hypothetical protein
VKIENRQHVLAALAIAVVGLLLLDKLVITPLIAGWKERSLRIADLQKSITQGSALLARGETIRERWSNMQTNTLQEASAERKILEAFQRWSEKSNISISSIQPNKRTEEDHISLECRANASGRVEALARFLYEIEHDPMALRVENLEITSRDESGRTLSLALQVSGLILTEAQE